MKIQRVDKELSEILQEMFNSEELFNAKLSQVHEDYHLSAKNLYQYLVLRSHDLRKYHNTLSDLGISSLRTSEKYVFSNLVNVVKNLRLIQGKSGPLDFDLKKAGYVKSRKLLKKHANSLFNETKKKHFTEIMVTLPIEAADDKSIIKGMVQSGMEIARINLTHGDIKIWRKMVDIIHEVQKETKLKIKIYMDLSGPKIRTSTIKIQSKKGKLKSAIPIRMGEHIILTKRDTLVRGLHLEKQTNNWEKQKLAYSCIV